MLLVGILLITAAAQGDESIESDRPRSVEDLRALQKQVRSVVHKARPATVAVEMRGSVGSGVVVSAEGLVLTAGHVSFEPNRKVWIRFPDNQRVRGKTLGVNHPLDSGLIQITAESPSESGWPHVLLAEEEARPGEWVVGLGQPNGFIVDRAPPVRLGRVLYVRDDTINTDVTLVGGDSGGPLLNLRGELIGIHSRIGERVTSNFHVPAKTYRREWKRLLAGRMTGVPDEEDPEDSRPLLGMAVQVEAGNCVVTQVFPDKPAQQAGVEVGDVLLELAGKRVVGPVQLVRIAQQQQPFDRVHLAVRRGEERREMELWIARTDRHFPGLAGSEAPE